jgi:hypothetical protein
MLPSHTDSTTLSKLSQLSGEYLPKIAAASGAERKKLLCRLVGKIYDVWTEKRAALVKSSEDLPAFDRELQMHKSLVAMPLLARVLTEKPHLSPLTRPSRS